MLNRPIAAALLVGAIAGLTIAGTVTIKTVHGKMQAADSESDAAGRFQMSVTERGERTKEKLRFTAEGLDTKKDDDGNRPVYELVLLTGDDDEVELGSVRLRRNGDAKFQYSSKQGDLGDDVVLSGRFPSLDTGGDEE